MKTNRQTYDVLTRAVDFLDTLQEQAYEVTEKVHDLVDEVASVVLGAATEASENIKQHLQANPLEDPVVPTSNVRQGPWGQATDDVKNSSGAGSRAEKIEVIVDFAANDATLGAQAPSREVIESMPDALVEPLYQMVKFLKSRRG